MGTICSSSGSMESIKANSQPRLRPTSHKSNHEGGTRTSLSSRSMPARAEPDTGQSSGVSPPGSLHTPEPTVTQTVVVARETTPPPGDPSFLTLEGLPQEVADRVCGRLLDSKGILDDKMVRIYHAALLKDSHQERDLLYERVYPRLQASCLERGLDLQVTDLHWGLRDSASHHGYLSATYRQQLEALLRRDSQAIIVVFLNDKYGDYGCPLRVDHSDLRLVIEKASPDQQDILNKWYELDENNIPAMYRLLPVTRHIPEYGSSVKSTHLKAYKGWAETMDSITTALWDNSDQQFQRKYLVSSLEKELEESVFSGKVNTENVVWVRRSFVKMEDAKCSDLVDYTDLLNGETDETARTKLNNLTNRLNDKVKQGNKIVLEIPWHAGRLDLQRKEHAQYVTELCVRYEETLRLVLDRVLDAKMAYDRTRVSMVGAGMEKTLYNEILHHTIMCESLAESFVGQELTMLLLKNYVSGAHPTSTSKIMPLRPLVVTGVEGSGKSALAAMLAIKCCTYSGWTGSVCIFRHVGATADSMTLDQVLASIGVQICFLYGIPYNYAHKPSSLYPAGFAQLLGRVPETTPLLVIIDGVDLLEENDDISWVPPDLAHHVRLVLTVTEGTKTHSLLSKLPGAEEGFIVDVPDLGPDNAMEIVNTILDGNRRRLTNGQRVAVETVVKDNPSPLFAILVAQCASYWTSAMDSHNLFPSKINLKELVSSVLLGNLEKCHGEECTGRLLCYIGLLQYGVSDVEMDDLLSSDEGVLLSVYPYDNPEVRRAPCFLWADVKVYLGPCLLERTVSGGLLTKWRHKGIHDVIMEKYRSYEVDTKLKLLDYFGGRWASGNMMPFASQDKAIEQVKDRFVKPQPNKFGNFYNRRKLDELPHCFIQNNMLDKLKNDVLLNAEQLAERISASGLYGILHDYAFYLKEQDNKAIQFLYDVMRQLAPILSQEGCHLWPQLILRVQSGKLAIDQKACPEIHDIYQSLTSESSPPRTPCPAFLTPSYFNVLDMQEPTEAKPEPHLGGLFHVRGDQNHMISVCPENGEVTVWNIHHQEAVRGLRGLPEPKDIRMIDSFKAVILSGRELRLYNLDEGTEDCRLKGVLNLKMPFFGVLDADHTVALSRNRMYVNIIKNTTGDVEATFKVGEDRFLDSLLVSANGEVCVCGDQVQKPFPLLVWDLINRKLLHDLRMAGHEFLTRMSAITNEGHYVVCVCKLVESDIQTLENTEANFLIVYDLLSGTLFKKWKPAYNTTSVAISSASSLVVSGHEEGTIIVWDLVGGAQKYTLSGHSRGPNHLRLSEDGCRAVSCDLSGRDTSVWVWDIDKGECLGSFITEFGVSCCEISPDGAAIVVGVPGYDKVVTLWATSDDRDRSKTDISIYGDASRSKQTFDLD